MAFDLHDFDPSLLGLFSAVLVDGRGQLDKFRLKMFEHLLLVGDSHSGRGGGGGGGGGGGARVQGGRPGAPAAASGGGGGSCPYERFLQHVDAPPRADLARCLVPRDERLDGLFVLARLGLAVLNPLEHGATVVVVVHRVVSRWHCRSRWWRCVLYVYVVVVRGAGGVVRRGLILVCRMHYGATYTAELNVFGNTR